MASTILYISSLVMNPSLSTSYNLNAPVNYQGANQRKFYIILLISVSISNENIKKAKKRHKVCGIIRRKIIKAKSEIWSGLESFRGSFIAIREIRNEKPNIIISLSKDFNYKKNT